MPSKENFLVDVRKYYQFSFNDSENKQLTENLSSTRTAQGEVIEQLSAANP
jgi:hypothetical protein